MIVLYTDFSHADPYVGQMHAVLACEAPGIPVIDLLHAVPDYSIRAGAYLLPALAGEFPPDTVFVGVVDPGVGGARLPVMYRADGRWYVGPDNGLFEIVKRRARQGECRVIRWRPARLSASFHGRDLFAPVAARLARGEMPDSEPATLTVPDGLPWPDELAEILFVDHFGNAITGLRAVTMIPTQALRAGGELVRYARVFSEVPSGTAFWYANANGLVEIAVNRGHAGTQLGLKPGDPVAIVET